MGATSRRPYNSPRREASASATRQAVLAAAEAVFVERGYAGATLAEIARAGGVSLATVKLVAGTKAALLLEAFRARARGDAAEAAIAERTEWKAMLALADPVQLLRTWIRLSAAAHERTAALYEVIAHAGEPELVEIEEAGSSARRDTYGTMIAALDRLGALRSGLQPGFATDVAWLVNSPSAYRQAVRRGWTRERWEAWLFDAATQQLLAARPGLRPDSEG